MNENYKSENSCDMKEFIPHLCCLRVCIWFILDIRIHFIRHHSAGKCGEIYVLLDNPTRCATHGLITPHHFELYIHNYGKVNHGLPMLGKIKVSKKAKK
jgi:hypothetical protein